MLQRKGVRIKNRRRFISIYPYEIQNDIDTTSRVADED
jgi:hypothetical protein